MFISRSESAYGYFLATHCRLVISGFSSTRVHIPHPFLAARRRWQTQGLLVIRRSVCVGGGGGGGGVYCKGKRVLLTNVSIL